MPFEYKHILVLGATSGIGKALAEKFVSDGSKVIVVGRRKENLDAFVEQHGKDKASSYQFDIGQLSAVPDFVATVTREHPDIDCVFLNSGIQRSLDFTKPETIDLSAVDAEITTNYTSYLHLTVAFLPFLQKKQNATAFMYTTSGLALIPLIRCSNYCASKSALHHWILALREQMKKGPGNIKIIEIVPPAVETELHDAKNQPDLKENPKFAMPLDEFVNDTWNGLTAGDEEIVVGMAKRWHASFEPARQKVFHETAAMIAKMESQ